MPYKNFGHNFQNSFFPYMTKTWNNIQINQRCKNLEDFKAELKLNIKPPTIKHFSKGSKNGNRLITRLRVGRSDL